MAARTIHAARATGTNRPAVSLQRLWTAAATRLQTRRTRRLLAEMDTRMLSDIGVSPADAMTESNRRFWDVR